MRIRFEKPEIHALRQDFMLVDMHFHSDHSHDCATPVEAIVRRAQELDVYVALTDHNRIGGVLEAERLEPGRVKPGLEVTTSEGKDILLHFPSVELLEEFFEVHIEPRLGRRTSLARCRTTLPMAELLELLDESRALVTLAHPFALGPQRCYRFFTRNPSLLRRIHAFEVLNSALPRKSNLMALGWATQCGSAMLGGSDGHILQLLGSAFTLSRGGEWPRFLEEIKRDRAVIVGEESSLNQQIRTAGRILGEKSKVFQNRRREDRAEYELEEETEPSRQSGVGGA